jgi:pimeloyl-ACP methyl ester carboxylesterase
MRINVGGTLRVAELARTLPKLRRFVALGGYRATRLPAWFQDAPYPLSKTDQERLYKESGAYEASKLHAHRAIGAFAQEHHLPLTSVHPSTVIGSSTSGETNQLTGLADTAERLWQGRMPAMVGTEKTFIPIVCVDYLADFLASVPHNDATLGQDLCVLNSESPNLPGLVQEMAAHLGVRAPRRMLSKRFVSALPEAITGVEKETLTFLSEDRYNTRSAEEHANRAGLQMPDFGTSLHLWLDYLVATRFLKDEAGSGHFVSCAGSQTYVNGDLAQADTLFLHGLPWDGESGQGLSGAMGGETVRPDLPGMGRSSRSAKPLDEWLEELLASRSQPIRIVAHSLSSGVALRYALRRPERVSEVVLVSPFFLQAPAPKWMRCPSVTSRLLRTGNAEVLGSRLLGDESHSPAVTSAHTHLRRRGVSFTIAEALSHASQAEERASLLAALAETKTPLCLIHGAKDPLTSSVSHDVFAVENTGHNPHVQNPEAVAKVIRQWRQGAKRSLRSCSTPVASTPACPVPSLG